MDRRALRLSAPVLGVCMALLVVGVACGGTSATDSTASPSSVPSAAVTADEDPITPTEGEYLNQAQKDFETLRAVMKTNTKYWEARSTAFADKAPEPDDTKARAAWAKLRAVANRVSAEQPPSARFAEAHEQWASALRLLVQSMAVASQATSVEEMQKSDDLMSEGGDKVEAAMSEFDRLVKAASPQ